MSNCGCNVTPCACAPTPDPSCVVDGMAQNAQDPAHFHTLCDGERINNVWVEGGTATVIGICMLDTLEEHQIINIIQRDPQARIDLAKVTTNPYLLNMLERIPMLPGVNEGDELQKEVNQNTVSPFYSQFRGQIPWNG